MNKLTDSPRTDAAKPKLTRESYDEDWNLKTENDTPRTDEQIWTTCFDHRSCDVVDMEFARQLERELAQSLENQVKSQAEVERLRAINADMRNFLAKAIHNEGFNEDQALKFIYQ